MTRILATAGVALVAISLEAQPAEAREGPWCAVLNVGSGSSYEDCQYATFEACRPHVLAGSRGFCNQNPRWVGPPAGTKTRSKRKARNNY